MLAHAGAMFPHSRGNGMGGGMPHTTQPYNSSCHQQGLVYGGVIGSLLGEPLVTQINLMVLHDQQTKDEKLEPQGSLPSRGRACHGCACGGKARTDHPPGHGPSSPSLGRWVDSSPQLRSRKFPATVTLGPAYFSKDVAGYAFIWARC